MTDYNFLIHFKPRIDNIGDDSLSRYLINDHLDEIKQTCSKEEVTTKLNCLVSQQKNEKA